MERLDGSFLANPEQAGDAEVDLVDQGEIFVALGVLDFIDANGVDLAQLAVLQTPGDDMLDSVKNLSQEVRKAWAVSFHERRRAQRARNSM